MKQSFFEALQNNDKKALSLISKGDLHNHAMFSCDREYLAQFGINIPQNAKVKDIASLIQFARQYIKPIQQNKDSLFHLLNGTILKAKNSGVKRLETSIDYKICITTFDNSVANFVDFLKSVPSHNINVNWIIDISRDSFVASHESLILQMLHTKFFAGLDLTSTENVVPNDMFKNLYCKANGMGLITKVHAGEQLGADYIKKCIIDFEPKQIQHGISIVQDIECVELAKQHNILFNVCPTSNVVLGYAKDISTHPIKQMVELGLKVTIATDDYILFESDINDEYLKLYNNKVLSLDQLETIRQNSLCK